ncbi:MAG: ABC-type dipeptide/oligopeptide/nickel transport system permease component [Flavobacteriales bacterium]|jgi:ABC-type dipeptide/oligopeptide/nickel transport system permease component
MIKNLLNKLTYGVAVLFGVATLVFLLFALKPGDPVRMMGGQFVDEATKHAIEVDLGLNYSTGFRYIQYLNDLSPISYYQEEGLFSIKRVQISGYNIVGNVWVKFPYLRKSYQTKLPVTRIIANTFPSTALLACISMLFALFFGIILGVFSALKKGTLFDQSALFVSVLGMSGPSFFMAILLSWLGGFVWYQFIQVPILPLVLGLLLFFLKVRKGILPAIKQLFIGLVLGFVLTFILNILVSTLHWDWLNPMLYHISLPGTGLNMTGSLTDIHPFEGEYTSWKNLILPALTLGIRPLAVVVQLTRNTLLEVLNEDYIRTATAMGLSRNKIIFKYALKNSLAPVITTISGWFASLLAGAVFVEFVFGWKGLGLTVFNALEKEDMPVVMGCVLFFASIFVIINILVDITYNLLDPRTRNN